MGIWEKSTAVVAICLVTPLFASAQSNTQFPETLDGFTSQFAQVTSAYESPDRYNAALATFRMPDEWFVRVFGSDKAAEMAGVYRKHFDLFVYSTGQGLRHSSRPGKVRTKPVDYKPTETLPSTAPTTIEDLPEIHTFRFEADTPMGLASWTNSFMYVDGAFRFFGGGSSPFWSPLPQPPIGGVKLNCPGGRLTVSSPHIIRKLDPKWPDDAKRKGIIGVVRIRATVATDGTVKSVKVLSGDLSLAESASDSVSHWLFEPFKVCGQVMEMDTDVTVNFR